MTPLLLLMCPALASAAATTEFMRPPGEHFNASFANFDPAGGASLSKVGDKVKDAVNDPGTKVGYQGYLDMMGMADAWSVQKAYNPIPITTLVADTGITAQHEDLKNKLAKDNNGRHGYNFFADSDDITDSCGHGTVMAGIVAAEVNNSKGIAGVDPMGRILTGKTGPDKTELYTFAIALAVPYALENGAQVVLLACGTYNECPGMESLREAMWKAQQSNKIFFVMTAGNDGADKPRYPCAYRSQYTLCVGASMSDKMILRPSSNYGPHVDVLAPGDLIGSTSRRNAYSKSSGTSPAAAIVAGLVSMLLSVGIEADRIKDLILGSCDKLEPYPGRQINSAGGFINATRALRSGLGLPL